MGRWDHTDGEPGDDDPPGIDLDERACPRCRRDLLPWDDECPECREPAVLRFALAPAFPAPSRELLTDVAAGADAAPGAAAAGEAASGEVDVGDAQHLISHALGLTHEETREPVDDVDGPPQAPPIAGDPHFG